MRTRAKVATIGLAAIINVGAAAEDPGGAARFAPLSGAEVSAELNRISFPPDQAAVGRVAVPGGTVLLQRAGLGGYPVLKWVPLRPTREGFAAPGEEAGRAVETIGRRSSRVQEALERWRTARQANDHAVRALMGSRGGAYAERASELTALLERRKREEMMLRKQLMEEVARAGEARTRGTAPSSDESRAPSPR